MAERNTQSDDTFQNELIEGNEIDSTLAVTERGDLNARCPVCHQVIGAAAGDAEHGSAGNDAAVSGNVTDDAVSGNVTDDAEPGNVTDADPDCVTGDVASIAFDGNAEPTPDRCPKCQRVLPATVLAAGTDAETGAIGGDIKTGATGGDAAITMVPRASVVYYNSRVDNPFPVNIAGPGERFAEEVVNHTIRQGGRRTAPQEPTPQRFRPDPFHMVVGREEVINQEDDRRAERRQERLERNATPGHRTSWMRMLYENRCLAAGVSCGVAWVIGVFILVVYLCVTFLSRKGASGNDTGSSGNDTEPSGGGIYLRGSRPRTEG